MFIMITSKLWLQGVSITITSIFESSKLSLWMESNFFTCLALNQRSHFHVSMFHRTKEWIPLGAGIHLSEAILELLNEDQKGLFTWTGFTAESYFDFSRYSSPSMFRCSGLNPIRAPWNVGARSQNLDELLSFFHFILSTASVTDDREITPEWSRHSISGFHLFWRDVWADEIRLRMNPTGWWEFTLGTNWWMGKISQRMQK